MASGQLRFPGLYAILSSCISTDAKLKGEPNVRCSAAFLDAVPDRSASGSEATDRKRPRCRLGYNWLPNGTTVRCRRCFLVGQRDILAQGHATENLRTIDRNRLERPSGAAP